MGTRFWSISTSRLGIPSSETSPCRPGDDLEVIYLPSSRSIISFQPWQPNLRPAPVGSREISSSYLRLVGAMAKEQLKPGDFRFEDLKPYIAEIVHHIVLTPTHLNQEDNVIGSLQP